MKVSKTTNGMNRAHPITPTPVVAPLYRSSNSGLNSDSNKSSPLQSSKVSHATSSNEVLSNSPSPEKQPKDGPYSNHKISQLTSKSQDNFHSVLNKDKCSALDYSKQEEILDFAIGTCNEDDMTFEEIDGYEPRGKGRVQYEIISEGQEGQSEHQVNIPGSIIDNCNHSTQIFVKIRTSSLGSHNRQRRSNQGTPIYEENPASRSQLMIRSSLLETGSEVLSQQPHGHTQRICNIKKEKNGDVTVYMSKPQNEPDNTSSPKVNEENTPQDPRRKKECQNLQNPPNEPPKIIPRRNKRKTKTLVQRSDDAQKEHIIHLHHGAKSTSPTYQTMEEGHHSINNYDPELGYGDNGDNSHGDHETDNRLMDNSSILSSCDAVLENAKGLCKSLSGTQWSNKATIGSSDKRTYLSVGIQVSPSPQYRLRFLPICGCTSFTDEEQRFMGTKGIRFVLKLIGRWILSQCGLGSLLFIWALLGAASFRLTEGPFEEEQAEQLANMQENLVIELANDLRLSASEEAVWCNTIEKYVAKHEAMLLGAVSSGYGEGGGGKIWSYAGCILFAVSLLTTLGFGAPVPRTTLGRIAAVIFAAIGIPLHLLLVLNIGMLIAVKLQFLALKWQPGTSFPSALFQCCCRYKSKRPPTPVHRINHPPTEECGIPISASNPSLSPPCWLKWFPAFSIIFYYTLGIFMFGVSRSKPFADCLLFPLDFTAAGGVGLTSGTIRTIYAIYLEGAVILAAIAVSILQVSASRGLTDLGLKLGLLTNS